MDGRLHRGQGLRDLRRPHVPDHQEVGRAVRPGRGARGPQHDGVFDPGGQRGQRLTDGVAERDGLRDQALELGEDGRVLVGLVEDVPPLLVPLQEAGAQQRVQLARDGALGGPAPSDDVADVERLVRMSEEEAEHTPARLAEEDGAGVEVGGSHFEF